MRARAVKSHARAERLRRWESLMDDVTSHDVTDWRDSFVRALEATPAREPELSLAEH